MINKEKDCPKAFLGTESTANYLAINSLLLLPQLDS